MVYDLEVVRTDGYGWVCETGFPTKASAYIRGCDILIQRGVRNPQIYQEHWGKKIFITPTEEGKC